METDHGQGVESLSVACLFQLAPKLIYLGILLRCSMSWVTRLRRWARRGKVIVIVLFIKLHASFLGSGGHLR